jgi:DNA processing protein
MKEKIQAWLCLKSIPKSGFRGILSLLEKYPNPLNYVGKSSHAIYDDRDIPSSVRDHLRRNEEHPRLTQILKLCDIYGIKMICLGDEDYPLGLAQISGPPLILWYRGELLPALENNCLAVVGTRKPSAYGRQMCAKLITPACKKGLTIVSGLAYGIDTIAHQTAVQNGAKTISVLAGGLESIYPAANQDLAKKIIENGALVSEYEPGTKLDPWNFPARNRIISALSQKTFIVEGPITSGAMLTAKFAIEQNRDLMALPGQVNHPNAQGPNYLIKNGAQCITTPEDILSSFGLDLEDKDQLEAVPDISEDEQKIFDLFKTQQREISFDELILQTGLPFGKLSTILLNLELKGYISKSGGNSFILG